MTDGKEIKLTFDPKSHSVDRLYESLYKLVQDKKLTTLTIVSIVTSLMQIVQNYDNITGPEKKLLVTHVLKRFVRDNMDGDEEVVLLNFIDLFLPSIIDTIKSVDNGKIKIKIKKFFKRFFRIVKNFSCIDKYVITRSIRTTK